MQPFKDGDSESERAGKNVKTSSTTHQSDKSSCLDITSQPFKPSQSILMSDDNSSRGEAIENPSIKHSLSCGATPKQPKPKNMVDLDVVLPKNCKERKFVIQTLEKELSHLEMRLEVAETWDLSLDDLDNSKSKYIQMHKLRERYRSTWERYCKMTNFDQKNIFSKIKVTTSDNPVVNQKMEKWMADFNQFPNFTDVQQQLERIVAEQHGLVYDEPSKSNISAASLNSLAGSIFLEIGMQIIKSRKRFYKFYFDSYLPELDVDPADFDLDLSHKLSSNFKVFVNAMDNVQKHFQQINAAAGDADETVAEHYVSSSDNEDASDLSSLSSLSSSSVSNDHTAITFDKSQRSERSSSSLSKSFSLESEDDGDDSCTFDQLYVDRWFSSQSTPQNKILIQNTKGQTSTPNAGYPTSNGPVLSGNAVESLEAATRPENNASAAMRANPASAISREPQSNSAIKSSATVPSVTSAVSNTTTCKRIPLTTISNVPKNSVPTMASQNSPLASVSGLSTSSTVASNSTSSAGVGANKMVKSIVGKCSRGKTSKNRPSNSKKFKPKPLTQAMIEEDNRVKMENHLNSISVHESQPQPTVTSIYISPIAIARANPSTPRKKERSNSLSPKNVKNLKERANCEKFTSTGLNCDTNIQPHRLSLTENTTVPNTDESAPVLQADSRVFTNTQKPTTISSSVTNLSQKTFPCPVEPNREPIPNTASNLNLPQSTKPITLVSNNENSSFYITGSSVPYTPNFLPKVTSTLAEKGFELMGVAASNGQIVTLPSTSTNSNHKSSPNLSAPPPDSLVVGGASRKSTRNPKPKIPKRTVSVGVSLLKPKKGKVPTIPKSVKAKKTKSLTDGTTVKNTTKCANKIKKRVQDLSNFFNPQNVGRLSRDDLSKLNNAFQLMESIQKSQQTPTTTIPSKSTRKSQPSTIETLSSYEIPKVGKRKRKLKPINPSQPSKKPKF